MKRHRVVASLAVAAAAVLAVIFVPLPFHVACTLELEPHGAQLVYPDTAGRLLKMEARLGEEVREGDVLTRVENLDLELDVERLKGKVAETEAQLDSLRRQRHGEDRSAGLQIPPLEESLATFKQQLEEKTRQLERLNIVAPIAGTVLPPPFRSSSSSDGRLPEWSGSPFDPHNVGALLKETDLVCRIGDPNKLEAVLVIDQADIDLVAKKNPVSVKLEALPGETFHSVIEEIAASELQVSPRSLASQAGGELNTRIDTSGVPRPMSTSYQARTRTLDDPNGLLRMGLRGRAKVYTGWQPLGRRLYRFLARTFHFEL